MGAAQSICCYTQTTIEKKKSIKLTSPKVVINHPPGIRKSKKSIWSNDNSKQI